MKKTIVALSAVATLGGVSGIASAVQIMGAASCGKWIERQEARDRDPWPALATETWLTGYLSGIAVSSEKDILRDADKASLVLWMTNYCKGNPLNDIADGAEELYFDLRKKNGIK